MPKRDPAWTWSTATSSRPMMTYSWSALTGARCLRFDGCEGRSAALYFGRTAYTVWPLLIVPEYNRAKPMIESSGPWSALSVSSSTGLASTLVSKLVDSSPAAMPSSSSLALRSLSALAAFARSLISSAVGGRRLFSGSSSVRTANILLTYATRILSSAPLPSHRSRSTWVSGTGATSPARSGPRSGWSRSGIRIAWAWAG